MRANPLSLEVWHFVLRFVLPGGGLATPAYLERRVVDYWTQRLPKVHWLSREEEEEESYLINLKE